jgi:hypothetical protein
MAFFKLGQREDPDFAFRAMVIRTLWPGSTTEQVDLQITDRIEKKLQEVPYFKWTRSYSKPGESLIVLELLDTAPAKDVPALWYQVRKKVGDIRATLPAEAIGPFYNDEFGDVFGTIYALPATGFAGRSEGRVERVRQKCCAHVQKVELIGTVDERIFIEISPRHWLTWDRPVAHRRAVAGAKRRVARRRGADRDPCGAFARHRPVRQCARSAGASPDRQFARDPPGRRGPRVARLCRSADIDHAFWRASGDRPMVSWANGDVLALGTDRCDDDLAARRPPDRHGTEGNGSAAHREDRVGLLCARWARRSRSCWP